MCYNSDGIKNARGKKEGKFWSSWQGLSASALFYTFGFSQISDLRKYHINDDDDDDDDDDINNRLDSHSGALRGQD